MLKLHIDAYTDMNLEDSMFIDIKRLSKMNNHIFQSLSAKLYKLFNFKEHLDNLIKDDMLIGLMTAAKNEKLFIAKYDEIKDESIPVPMGFNGNLIGITGVIDKYFRDYLTMYEERMTTFNQELSEFINSKDARTKLVFSYDNTDLKKHLIKMDKEIHDQLTKYKSPVATVGDLFVSKKGFGEVVKNLTPSMRYINSKRMKEYVGMVRALNVKLKALQDMVEVEKDTVSKKALVHMIEEIELAANMATLLGKYALAAYETVNIMKSVNTMITK